MYVIETDKTRNRFGSNGLIVLTIDDDWRPMRLII